MKISVSDNVTFSKNSACIWILGEKADDAEMSLSGENILVDGVRAQLKNEGVRDVVSVGKHTLFCFILPEKGKELSCEDLRKTIGPKSRMFAARGIVNISLYVSAAVAPNLSAESIAQAAVEGTVLGQFRHDDYRTESKEKGYRNLTSLTFIAPDKSLHAGFRKGAERGVVISKAVCQARLWTGKPLNDLYPEKFAKEIREWLKGSGVTCKVLTKAQCEKLGMGAYLSVALGSDYPPNFVIAEYNGAANKNEKPIVLIGKGIMFDTGGYSIKLAAKMYRMKDDMAGAASVFSVVKALAELKVKRNVIAISAVCDNGISGKAYRPGDIVTSMKGLTIEILSTDAEGRLTLCDAIEYSKRYKPACIIDVATLTGGVVVSLGKVAFGIFGNDEKMLDMAKAACERTGEKGWHLPIFPEYHEDIRGEIADIANVSHGTDKAHAPSAAAFLEKFVDDIPWVHLDIAGTCWYERDLPYSPNGASGSSVRMLIDFVENYGK
ncbi:MAG: leucyl aminopeptidase [Planctomycetes bacterium]|nr:leucyl aminopeptidase [Planctomycetota bacterium]